MDATTCRYCNGTPSSPCLQQGMNRSYDVMPKDGLISETLLDLWSEYRYQQNPYDGSPAAAKVLRQQLSAMVVRLLDANGTRPAESVMDRQSIAGDLIDRGDDRDWGKAEMITDVRYLIGTGMLAPLPRD